MEETRFQRITREQEERRLAREQRAKEAFGKRRAREAARTRRKATRNADRVDGFDRDDLGESPDF